MSASSWRVQFTWVEPHKLGPHLVAHTEDFPTLDEAHRRIELIRRSGVAGFGRDPATCSDFETHGPYERRKPQVA